MKAKELGQDPETFPRAKNEILISQTPPLTYTRRPVDEESAGRRFPSYAAPHYFSPIHEYITLGFLIGA